jgi:hypothetical protein
MAVKTTRLLWDNKTLDSGVTITSSAEATGYQDDYVSNRARWKKWRSSTTTGDQWLKYDLGSSQTLKAIFLVNYTAHTSGGTIKVQANATDSWGSPTVDETLSLPSLDLTGVVGAFFSSQSLQWVRVYFTNVGAVNEYVEVGLTFAGDYLEPGDTIFHRFPFRRVDPSVVVHAQDGQEEVQTRSKFHQFSGEFQYRGDTEKDSFAQMFDTVGGALPIFFILDTADVDLQFYGRIERELALYHQNMAGSNDWSIPFNFTESL